MEKSKRTKIRKRRKELFIEKFGGKCQICGYDRCPDSLVFHHIDESKKEYSPCKIIYEGSLERAEKELSKCIMVCANCHGEIHSKHFNHDIDVSRYISKWIKIECKFCHKPFLSKRRSKKFCDHRCSALSQRKVKNRPNKTALKILIKRDAWKSIGDRYSVGANTVKKWARSYGLI